MARVPARPLEFVGIKDMTMRETGFRELNAGVILCSISNPAESLSILSEGLSDPRI
jgi:hypothetical protein